jgi:sugar/nucleoside kinase (ribokinase family)
MEYEEKKPKVIGIGNALVDIINVQENDALLDEFGLHRGSMTLVDAELSRKIYDATYFSKREITTGGSAANTIHALANLGVGCGYVGKIGNDMLGKIFSDEFERKKIDAHLLISSKDTGRVIGLVSPDSERTMATYLGAASDLKPEDLSRQIFRGYSVLYIEGYLVQDHKLIETAIDLAIKERLSVAIDLSSFNVVENHLDFLKNLISEKVNIVFANEEEAFAFTGKDPGKAVQEIASMSDIAIVKVGKEGSLIQSGDIKIKVESIKAKAIDTTGAGDNYAAGFLLGLIRGYSLEKSGRIASLISGKVVEVIGAKLPEIIWPGLLKDIEAMN